MNSLFRAACQSLLLTATAAGSAFGADCAPIPFGLVGWWRAENSTTTFQGESSGTLVGGASYAQGKVGQAFNFNGIDSGLLLGKNPAFHLQNFTFEAWVKRASAERPSQVAPYYAALVAGGANHFALAMFPDGRMTLGKVGISNAYSSQTLDGTEWHHIAVTKANSLVQFYIDGKSAGATVQSSTFSFETSLAIGSFGESYPGVGTEPFWGMIDEPSLYDRALSEEEVATIYRAGVAGKCGTTRNLISNGSFEEPAYPSGQGAIVRTQWVPGWEVAAFDGATEVQLGGHGGATAAAGAQSLELEGAEGLPAYFIRQAVTVSSGRLYRLRFAYAKNPFRERSRMRVELIGASVAGGEFDHAIENTLQNPEWVRDSIDFVATSSQMTVQFTGLSPNPGFGMLLDELELLEVGEIPLANPSFELLTGTNLSHFDLQGQLLDGHYSALTEFPFEDSGFGVSEPIPSWVGNALAGTVNPPSSLFAAGVPHGQNVAWLNAGGQIGQLLGAAYKSGRHYRLEVDVGWPTGVGFTGYVVGLYADGQVVAEDRNTLAILEGQFRRVTVEGILPPQSPLLGALIEVRLGNPGSQLGQVNFDNVRLTVESPEPPLECAPQLKDLAVWYRGEGTAADWLGRHPGTFAGGRYVAGSIGLGFEFDGTNEVVVPDAPVFNRDTFTIEAWVFPTSLDGAVDILVNKEVGPEFSQFQFELGIKGPVNDITGIIPLGNLAFYLGGVTGLPDDYGGWVDGLANVPLNRWTHVALGVEPGTVSVYVNGVETRRLTGLGGAVRTTSGALKLGSRHDWFVSHRPAERFNGRMDDFGFYTRKLATAEIATSYRSGDRCSEDLAVLVTAPAKVAHNEEFIITAMVSNYGNSEATQVTLTNVIPAGISVLATTNSQGQTMNFAGLVISDLGSLPGGQTATVHLLCRALVARPYQVSASIGRGEVDFNLENNHHTLDFEAVPLALDLEPRVSVVEGIDSAAEITVSLSSAVLKAVTVEYFTVEGTAQSGRDFTAMAGSLTIPPGVTRVPLRVPILDDAFFEAEEAFTLVLTNAIGAQLGRSNTVVTITSKDPKPRLEIEDVIVHEGNGFPTNVMVQVRLIGATENPVSVAFSTLNQTALSPTDYVATNGVLSFAPGVAEQMFSVRVNGDTVVEPNEAFFVNLSGAINAEVAKGTGAVVIVNDDFMHGQVVTFGWEPMASSQELGRPFAARFSARDGGDNLVADFNGAVQLSASVNGKRPTSVLISEVDRGAPNSEEFTNVSTNEVDVSGWIVFLYDDESWPLPKGSVRLPSFARIAPGAVFRVLEGTSPAARFPNVHTDFQLEWGSAFNSSRPNRVAVLWQDAAGKLVDFFCAADALPGQITVPSVVPNSEWVGPPLPNIPGGRSTYQRQGISDFDNAADWTTQFPSPGHRNFGLAVPFTDSRTLSVAPELALEFTGGVWSGMIQLNTFAPMVSLVANDGNGHVGFSAPFALTTPNDLAVSLRVTPDRAVVPIPEIHYSAIVTNPGPDISSNVVVEVRLDASFGQLAYQALRRIHVSQGSTRTSTYTIEQPPLAYQALRIVALFGEISPGGTASMNFEAVWPPYDFSYILPTNIVATATATGTQPDLNPFNNTATAAFEISRPCVALTNSSQVMGWWRGEGNGLDSIRGNHLVAEGEGEFFGEGRVEDHSLRFTATGAHRYAPNNASLNFAASEDFTIEAWVRVPARTIRERLTLLDKRDPSNGSGYVWFIEHGQLGMTLVDRAGASVTGLSGAPQLGLGASRPDLRDGNWHHLVAVLSHPHKARLSLFIDGRESSSDFASPGDLTTAAPLRFGYDFAGGLNTVFEGEIDELSIYRFAMDYAGVWSIYGTGAAGKCVSDLVLNITAPEQIQSQFSAPLVLGRPIVVSLLLTNAGPLGVPTTWLQAELSREFGTTRLLTPPLATNVINESNSIHDFGPLEAGASRMLQTEVTLTNLPPNLTVNYAASFQFTGLRVRNRGVSADFRVNPDHDADGLRDDWELAYGLNSDNPADAVADADLDGVSNLNEYLAASDPRNAADHLRLEVLSHTVHLVKFRALTKSGRSYQLLRAVDSVAEKWDVIMDAVAGTGAILEFSDSNPPIGNAFYRLRVM